MLRIKVVLAEDFDDERQEFIESKTAIVELEHSLVSLSKWEAEWEKPFLATKDKTTDETISYVAMMLLTPDVPEEVFLKLIENHLSQITAYISAKRTATWFSEDRNASRSREVITAEIIYYWMISLSVPFECQYWHLNQLITLIRVINHKNAPKKRGRQNSAVARRALNAQRRAQHNTTG